MQIILFPFKIAKSHSRENLFHICSRYNLIRFCNLLLKQPASMEALNTTNTKTESPYYVAMKNRFNQIADIM